MKQKEVMDYCLDNWNVSEQQFTRNLRRKLENAGKFDHSKENFFEACGLIPSNFDEIEIPMTFKQHSRMVEWLEENFSTREIAVICTNAYHCYRDLVINHL